jgi:DNA-directed RNA polymerase subunit RPC12/RpoP
MLNAMAVRLIRLRYRGTCAECGTPFAPGHQAWWDSETKQVRCQACGTRSAGTADGSVESFKALDVGVAGASARAEYERRKQRREDAIRSRHPRLGRLVLAVTDDPQSTKAWARGSVGEQRVGARLDELTAQGAIALHDRCIPGTKANIDHVVVAPSGIWVIDAKRYHGEVRRRDVGGWFRSDERLYVGKRDCTKLVTGMAKQVAAVRGAIDADVTIRPVLCFTEAEWSLFARPFELEGVLVIWPKALVKAIAAGTDPEVSVERVARQIAEHLPAAHR